MDETTKGMDKTAQAAMLRGLVRARVLEPSGKIQGAFGEWARR